MKKILLTIGALIVLATIVVAQQRPTAVATENKTTTEKMTQQAIPSGPTVMISTSLGDIKIRLYDATPRHRDNFLKLVAENYYDSVLFHRVIKDFMVQTGDPTSKNAGPNAQLGAGDPSYMIEAEIDYPRFFHKYGALAAARTADQVNPERRSSGSQFYIVTGKKYSVGQVMQMEQRMTQQAMQDYFQKLSRDYQDTIQAYYKAGDKVALEELRQKLIKQTEENVKPIKMTEEIVSAYTTVGGTPHLDGAYTVFGEVLDGMAVVEKIQNSATGRGDRPVEDIKILGMKVVEE